jgi:enoyl-CoA hydratase
MSLVGLAIEEGVATVTFFNPPRGYMNAQQVQELDEVIDALAVDDAVRAVVFTGGVPGVFVRHYDVSEILAVADIIRKSGRSDDELMEGAKAGNNVSSVFDKVDRFPKPTIAAINGFAQGGGFEFALCCDLRIADPGDYRIGLPETNIGIFPGAGGTERLPRLIGEAKALELILRGRTVEPDEALLLGMVHEVASRGALPRSLEIAKELAAKPPRGLADAKALVKGGGDKSLSDACGQARGRFSVLIARDEGAENAMRHFLNTGEDINKI